jgi:hypothetical protein
MELPTGSMKLKLYQSEYNVVSPECWHRESLGGTEQRETFIHFSFKPPTFVHGREFGHRTANWFWHKWNKELS